jgi:hypothetical protein
MTNVDVAAPIELGFLSSLKDISFPPRTPLFVLQFTVFAPSTSPLVPTKWPTALNSCEALFLDTETSPDWVLEGTPPPQGPNPPTGVTFAAPVIGPPNLKISTAFFNQTSGGKNSASIFDPQTGNYIVGASFGQSLAAHQSTSWALINLAGVQQVEFAKDSVGGVDVNKEGFIGFKFQGNFGPADANKYPFFVNMQVLRGATSFTRNANGVLVPTTGNTIGTYTTTFNNSPLSTVVDFWVTIKISSLAMTVKSLVAPGGAPF